MLKAVTQNITTVSAPLVKTGSTLSLNFNPRLVNNAGNLDLQSSVVTPGTYSSLTVDTYGRATAGSNTLSGVTITGASQFTNYYETLVTANSNTAYTINLTTGRIFRITLTGSVTFTFPTPTTAQGYKFEVVIIQGASIFSISWPASVKWPGGVIPVLTTTPGAIARLIFSSEDGGTTWNGNLAGDNYS